MALKNVKFLNSILVKPSVILIMIFLHLTLFSCKDNKPTEPSSTPTNGLVAFYPFNGNANDESGNGNHGTANGASLTSDRRGNPNSAFSFDGNGYIEIANASSLNPTEAFTIAGWFSWTSGGGDINQFFVSKRGSNDNAIQYEISKSDQGKFRPHVWTTNGGVTTFDGTTTVVSNQWYFVVMSYDGAEFKLYVNGDFEKSIALTGTVQALSNPLFLGKRGYFGGVSTNRHNLHGKIDDVRIYNRALNETEIQTLYNE